MWRILWILHVSGPPMSQRQGPPSCIMAGGTGHHIGLGAPQEQSTVLTSLWFADEWDPARNGLQQAEPLGQEQRVCPPCGPVRRMRGRLLTRPACCPEHTSTPRQNRASALPSPSPPGPGDHSPTVTVTEPCGQPQWPAAQAGGGSLPWLACVPTSLSVGSQHRPLAMVLWPPSNMPCTAPGPAGPWGGNRGPPTSMGTWNIEGGVLPGG